MKLIDILARELKEWPEGMSETVGQGHTGFLHGYAGNGHPNAQTTRTRFPLCEDYSREKVTRAEWQAAVDALNKAAWNGEGLPPVGAEFERRFVDEESSSWAWGLVLAYGKRRIFYVDRTGDEWAHALADLEFRPVRTPEQIAEAAKQETIAQLIADTGGELGPSGAALLYDAGYRKQVQP